MKTCCPHDPAPGADLAPGRYCLAICYCGHCPHYEPAPPVRWVPPPPKRERW